VNGRWVNRGASRRLSREALDALPADTVRTFDCGGVLVAMQKRADGEWQVTVRRVPSFVLAGMRSYERVKMQDEQSA
jgi:hypothetical protein